MANETPVNSSILQQFPAPDGALAERVLAGGTLAQQRKSGGVGR